MKKKKKYNKLQYIYTHFPVLLKRIKWVCMYGDKEKQDKIQKKKKKLQITETKTIQQQQQEHAGKKKKTVEEEEHTLLHTKNILKI